MTFPAHGLTLDCPAPIQLGAEHAQAEEEDTERKDDADAKADAPDSWEMVLAGRRKNNEEDSDG